MVDGFLLPRVKVCGMTRAEDVRCAVDAGAQAVGFVHYGPSPRSVEAQAVAPWIAALPASVTPVAVLVDPSPDEALAWLRASGARVVQLCGSEAPGDWGAFPFPILRRVGVSTAAADELERWSDVAQGFVLDHASGPGGTGQRVDSELAVRLAGRAPCLLAGGLDESNVQASIAAVRPAGVDAASRLEQAPGIKDDARVRAFVARALAALAPTGSSTQS